MRMFERLDTLLKIKVVESELAIALKEVPCILLLLPIIKHRQNIDGQHSDTMLSLCKSKKSILYSLAKKFNFILIRLLLFCLFLY